LRSHATRPRLKPYSHDGPRRSEPNMLGKMVLCYNT
jgi:hypothetical protein